MEIHRVLGVTPFFDQGSKVMEAAYQNTVKPRKFEVIKAIFEV